MLYRQEKNCSRTNLFIIVVFLLFLILFIFLIIFLFLLFLALFSLDHPVFRCIRFSFSSVGSNILLILLLQLGSLLLTGLLAAA